jgi:hypothetical protein
MPRPKLYQHGRKKMTLEQSLADSMFAISKHSSVPVTHLLDEAVTDWQKQKGPQYLTND